MFLEERQKDSIAIYQRILGKAGLIKRFPKGAFFYSPCLERQWEK